MSRYKKETSRLTLKYINADTEELLFEVRDKNHLDIGSFLSDGVVSQLLQNELKGKILPENVMVLVVGEFKLVE